MRDAQPPTDEPVGENGQSTDVHPLLAAYRHDVHKLRLRSHAAADDEVANVRVNEQVPCGADRDAALLSRPRGEPDQTVDRHESLYRRSLITGDVVAAAQDSRGRTGGFDEAVQSLLEITEPAAAHAWWLHSDVGALLNESPYYPYTSLKYHVVMTAALLDNYRAGHELREVCLTVASTASVPPHRTIATLSNGTALVLTAEPGSRPAAWLGEAPARSFGDVWARLPASPLPVDEHRDWRLLDAQLRRLSSWSAALQYIEDVGEWPGLPAASTRGDGDDA